MVPISNFVEKKPQQKVNYVRKFDSKHVTIIKADVSSGFTPESRLKLFETWIKDQSIPAIRTTGIATFSFLSLNIECFY